MAIYTAQQVATERGITAYLGREMNKYSSLFPEISDVRKSTSEEESYLIGGSMPGVRKWVGDREFDRLSAAKVAVANEPWESSLMFDRFHYDDDRAGLYTNALGELADEAAAHPDELMAEFLVKGESTECWDGQNFFDTDHAWRDSGTQDNIVSVNVVDTANPTPMELRDAFDACVERIKSFKKSNGKRYYRAKVEQLSDFSVFTPLAIANPFKRAYQQVISNEGGVATTNVTLESPKITPFNLINSDDTWNGTAGSDTDFYVFYTGARWKPLIFQPRTKIVAKIKGLTGDDIEHKDVKVMTEGRYNFAYFAWMNAIKCKLT